MTDKILVASGAAGYACEINVPPLNAAQTAELKSWMLHLPKQHPFWEDYMLSVISLRDIEGVRPATKKYSEAKFELLFLALSPDANPDPNNVHSIIPLLSPNYVRQFHAVTNASAVEMGLTMVEFLVEGRLLAEPEGVIGALALWNSAMQNLITIYQAKDKLVIMPPDEYFTD